MKERNDADASCQQSMCKRCA